MAGWHLDTKMAQDIVARTMRIIDTNIKRNGCPWADHWQRRSRTNW
ncbi:carbohydrate diacid transcriptional activator CdaR [Citrobacter freundii]|nr:carbohydrate diacid transcriptional activator CdaR [Citrobacter freundii]